VASHSSAELQRPLPKEATGTRDDRGDDRVLPWAAMESTPAPGWLIPLILLGFPVAFLAVWSCVCALIAATSGYLSLREHRLDGATVDEGEKLPSPWLARIGWASYRGGILSLQAGPAGLTLRIPRIFPFHPPVRIPWERIQETGGALLLDGCVRLRVPPATLEAIRDAKARHSGCLELPDRGEPSC